VTILIESDAHRKIDVYQVDLRNDVKSASNRLCSSMTVSAGVMIGYEVSRVFLTSLIN
jgi:hypothetical protein